VNFWYNTAKTGVFSRISQDMLDRFSQTFHRVKALWAQMIDLDISFRYLKGRGHGNQIMFNNERRLILPAFFALAFENELGISLSIWVH